MNDRERHGPWWLIPIYAGLVTSAIWLLVQMVS